jgi:glutathione S-transferase
VAVTLHGYRYSVYLRIARMALREKGVTYGHAEVDPFADEIPPDYLKLNPFGRVPTLVHDGFVLYETAAITRYVDEGFDGPPLQPELPRQRARVNQIVAVLDAYGYWPMVRQVYSQRVFNARLGKLPDEAQIVRGIGDSHKVLSALEFLAEGGPFVVADRLTLADLHMAALLAYFTAAPEGARALARYAKLSAWWQLAQNLGTLRQTEPGLP